MPTKMLRITDEITPILIAISLLFLSFAIHVGIMLKPAIPEDRINTNIGVPPDV